MEDKNLYNKVMLIAFCIILVLLGAGTYARSVAAQKASQTVPRGTVREVSVETEHEVIHTAIDTGIPDKRSE